MRRAAGTLRVWVFVHSTIATLPWALGFAVTTVAHSLTPVLIGIGFSEPALLVFGFPYRWIVEMLRRRVESAGVASYLDDQRAEIRISGRGL